ncbi:MAG: hypothetical protein ACKOWF_08730 [Chloroflexota bacterium]
MMDELDDERSSGQVIAAASAAAGLLGALALAMTRKREGQTGQSGAAGLGARPGGGSDFQQVVDQVAEVAPELVAALDRHAPDVSRKIRSKLPLVRAVGGGALADAVEFGRRPRRDDHSGGIHLRAAADDAADRVSGVAGEARERAEEAVERGREQVAVDFSALTAAQAAAAQAAIAAVSRAEQAFGAGERFAGLAGRGASDTLQPLIRDVAQQAATLAVDLWQNARTRGEASSRDDLASAARHAASDAASLGREALGLIHGAADGAVREAHEARARAERAREEAETALRELRAAAASPASVSRPPKKGGGGFKLMWLGTLLGLAFYVFIDEERRRETSLQVRELLRDLRGYDDEF